MVAMAVAVAAVGVRVGVEEAARGVDRPVPRVPGGLGLLSMMTMAWTRPRPRPSLPLRRTARPLPRPPVPLVRCT